MSGEFTQARAIRNLQLYLRQLSFFDDALPQLPIDGVWGTETQQAVEIFQGENRLPVTGIVDRATWNAIYQAYLNSVATYAKPEAVDIFYRNPIPSALRLGDIGFAVAAVQYMLNEILAFYGDRPDISTDGLFGEGTFDAVRLFQQYASLPATGEVNLETWNRMTQVYNELFRTSNQ